MYGLRVASSIPLPELSELTSDGNVTPDLVVHRGSLPTSPDSLGDGTCVYEDPAGQFSVFRSQRKLYWFYDGVGTLAVSDGRRVDVNPAPTVADGTLGRLVLGAGLCGALVQRGFLVFHASTVTVDGVTVAITGESGAGKSTAAAACYAQGHDIVTDDLTAVGVDESGVPTVTAGYPRLRVDERVVRALGLSDRAAGTSAGKTSLDVSDRFVRDERRLDAICLLGRGETVSATELSAQPAVFELLQASYSLYDETDTAAQRTHLEDCGTVADACSIRRATRPQSLARLDELVEVFADQSV
ncbi:hypothetical protein ACOZ4N_11355 [Halorientalis pallida]|uniref:hypothetical protein n=1 Tax=Halorientalis pallida TaxID=2479928 RepID=UPI003C6F6F84